MLEGRSEGVYGVAFSPDGQTLASGASDETVTPCVLRGHSKTVNSVAFSPDGQTIASGSDDSTVRLWSVATGACLAILLKLPEGWVAFTPEGRYKFGGDIANGFWHAINLCRFEPGELDEFIPGLRLRDDEPILPPHHVPSLPAQ